MTLYVDSSAFVKRYVTNEAHHEECVDLMEQHARWVTSRLSAVETPRALHRSGTRAAAVATIAQFDEDLGETILVDLDRGVLALAREVANETGTKTLDAVHLASAMQFTEGTIELLTYDRQQARAAEQVGLRLAR